MFTEEDVKQKSARMKKGEMLRGPEPYGCFNSGVAPTLTRLNVPSLDLYVVGPDLHASDVRRDLKHAEFRLALRASTNEHILHRRIFRQPNDPNGRRTVYVYRTKAPALKEFLRQCNAISAENEKEREAHRKAIEDFKSTDPERRARGALALMDY